MKATHLKYMSMSYSTHYTEDLLIKVLSLLPFSV